MANQVLEMNPEGSSLMERVLLKVKKVIVGQDHLLERHSVLSGGGR